MRTFDAPKQVPKSLVVDMLSVNYQSRALPIHGATEGTGCGHLGIRLWEVSAWSNNGDIPNDERQ